MADQTPDPTAWSGDQLDNLLDALAERASERDDLDLPGSGVSRRTVLATLLSAGGLGVGATQLGSAASWGSASGTLGAQSSPLDQANIRDLDAKRLEAEQYLVGSAKFVGAGDVLPIACFTQGAATSATTTSTTYTDETEVFTSRVPFGEIVPDGAQLAVNLSGTAFPGSGESYDIRVRNVDDGSTLVEATDASGKLSTGFVNYSNFTGGVPKTVRIQHRTNPGSNSSELLFPTIWIGLRF